MTPKFANLNFEGYQTVDKDGKINVNIGDFIEFIAIDQLYQSMGIKEEDIVTINFYEMNTYDGDPVILPINFRLMVDYPQWNIVNWSPKITPVFIGVSLVSTKMSDECKWKLKQYEPIGCRDEATYRMLRTMGIKAYIGACITLTLERCGYESQKEKKIFFIDVPEKVRKYIPEDFQGKVEILQHEFFDDMIKQWNGCSCKEYTKARLRKYEEEAGLIVTSRYHGTISALALGIPVISVLENRHDKFEVLEKIIPVYDAKDGESIDWYPSVVYYDELKENLRRVAQNHLLTKYRKMIAGQQNEPLNCCREMDELTEFFKTQKKEVKQALIFSEEAIHYIREHWKPSEEKKIAVWGYSTTAMDILNFLHEKYPKVKLMEIYDSFKYGNIVDIFGTNYLIKEPSSENLQNDYFIFVASNSASKIAESVFQAMGKKDIFLCRLNFITKY